MIDPIRFKKVLLTILKVLIVFELIRAMSAGFSTGDWDRLGIDLLLAGGLYLTWDRIRMTLRDKKAAYRTKMESGGENVRLWDAFIFSLLWSDEIYGDIPSDRKRLVVISYTLIALGLIAAFFEIGSGLMPLIISGALVLAAVNLLAWVVSSERGEKDELKTELRLAHEVQLSLMPKEQPSVHGFDIAGTTIPAREVGGDHYDYASLDGGSKFGISIFDVSGKGMQAAMSAVFTSGAFASEAKQTTSPADILTRLNATVYSHSKRGHFVAFLLASFDLATQTLAFANAGQMKPLLRSGDMVQWLESNGVPFPLGMTEDAAYEQQCVQLQTGDLLLLLTDGITEAMNAHQELFGTERLEKFVGSINCKDCSAQEILELIDQEIKMFAGDAPQHDDMTMVVVKVH